MQFFIVKTASMENIHLSKRTSLWIPKAATLEVISDAVEVRIRDIRVISFPIVC